MSEKKIRGGSLIARALKDKASKNQEYQQKNQTQKNSGQ